MRPFGLKSIWELNYVVWKPVSRVCQAKGGFCLRRRSFSSSQTLVVTHSLLCVLEYFWVLTNPAGKNEYTYMKYKKWKNSPTNQQTTHWKTNEQTHHITSGINVHKLKGRQAGQGYLFYLKQPLTHLPKIQLNWKF